MKMVVKIALAVALVAVIVLSIVVASVAWFTSSPEVGTNEVTMTAARSLTVSFDANAEHTSYRYRGSIGNRPVGDLDAPYVYDAGGFTLRINPSSGSSYGKVKVEFGTVTVQHDTVTVPNVLITDLFHIEANVCRQSNVGGYVKDPTGNYYRAYNEETDSGLTRYVKEVDPLTVASDGILMNGANPALFAQGEYSLSFTYTFLPEAAYAVWLAASAGEPGASFTNIHGYELSADGEHIGVIGYTAYVAKYHYGLTRYNEENGVYTPATEGDYVRVITGYQADNTVTKYAVTFAENESGTYYRYNGNYISQDSATDAEKAGGVLGNITGTASSSAANSDTHLYVKAGNDYLLYSRYQEVNGFPYSDPHYIGATYTFKIYCSVEEVIG